MLLLAIPFGLAIGLIVGAVGGGGAILALPVLVYVLGEGRRARLDRVADRDRAGRRGRRRRARPPRPGVLAAGAAVRSSRRRGVAGRCAAEPRRQRPPADPLVRPDHAAWPRARPGSARAPGARRSTRAARPRAPSVVVGAGLGVGMLTGFFGVGGGFMIVPVLALGLGLAFRRAVATSLVIITLTGVVALDDPSPDRRAAALRGHRRARVLDGRRRAARHRGRRPAPAEAPRPRVRCDRGAAGAVPAGGRDVARGPPKA